MFEIYGYSKDPFAWSVRFAATEKGVEYRWIPSDVAFPDPRAAKNNPTGRSPLVLHGELVLTGAFNIQLYLDESFPGRPLQPSTPRGRAEMRMFVDSLEGLATVLQGGPGRASFNKRAFKRMDEVFVAADERLGASNEPWLDGVQPGMRDISLLPLLSELEAMETSFPLTLKALTEYWQRAQGYGPFQKTNHRTVPTEGRP